MVHADVALKFGTLKYNNKMMKFKQKPSYAIIIDV